MCVKVGWREDGGEKEMDTVIDERRKWVKFRWHS